MLFKMNRICALLLAALLVIGCAGCLRQESAYQDYTGQTETPTGPSISVDGPLDNTDLPEQEEEEEEEPQPTVYTLSFAGDCTLGTDPEVYGATGTFVHTVGENYGYPFEKALPYFESDDFTLVNFEGVLAEEGAGREKEYRFRGPLSYAKILTAGSVEAVNLSNNHTLDFGEAGYKSTKEALNRENVPYVEHTGTILYTTKSGLKIGLYAAQFWVDTAHMESAIQKLREDGAEIVVVSYHGGEEGSYTPTGDQKAYAHKAIDAGADIFYGHHPHVLQPIEEYNGGVIYYSLGNFSFGGNRNPKDKDTAVIQQEVVRELDGTVHLGQTKIIPFCLSGESSYNTYQPTPYEEGSKQYDRVLSKLDGTFGSPITQTPTTETTTETLAETEQTP